MVLCGSMDSQPKGRGKDGGIMKIIVHHWDAVFRRFRLKLSRCHSCGRRDIEEADAATTVKRGAGALVIIRSIRLMSSTAGLAGLSQQGAYSQRCVANGPSPHSVWWRGCAAAPGYVCIYPSLSVTDIDI